MRAILTFHSIDDSGSVISYPPRRFARLLETLARTFRFVDLDELLLGGADDTLAITFDDGMRSVFENALPVLRANGVPAHLFLATDAIESDQPWPHQPPGATPLPMMTWDEVEALAAGGFAIENHTVSHPDLRTLDDGAIDDELARANETIASRLGRWPRYFAYPFGWYDDRVRQRVRDVFDGTVTTELGTLRDGEDPTILPRLDTYYLQSAQMLRTLHLAPTRAYLTARSLMRTVKGSHVVPSNDPLTVLSRALIR